MIKVGFIGAGNMGGSIARSAYSTKKCEIYVYDKDEEKAKALCDMTNGILTDVNKAVSECDIVFLATKPNILPYVADEINTPIKCTLISMAAGVSLEKLSELFGQNIPIIRIMPNTPVLVGMGVMVYCKNACVTKKGLDSFLSSTSCAGLVEEIEEEKIDAETAVAGCGPAFVYMFASALAEGGIRAGLSEDAAIKYAAATIKGAGEMLLRDTRTPEELCRAVCSPGGSTIEGVNALRAAGFDKTVSDAVMTSFLKTQKLGK